mmetsp:Transcript_76579/g.212722  ORF Transcript_76579/g.212722 Transcript_76579/m.212722 type:complete len:148 (+) Transcript_76579:415-858(+)
MASKSSSSSRELLRGSNTRSGPNELADVDEALEPPELRTPVEKPLFDISGRMKLVAFGEVADGPIKSSTMIAPSTEVGDMSEERPNGGKESAEMCCDTGGDNVVASSLKLDVEALRVGAVWALNPTSASRGFLGRPTPAAPSAFGVL